MARVLIIVENLPVPFDRRVWSAATTLCAAGHEVSVICPRGHGAEASYEVIDGICVWRHPLPFEARGAAGYLLEYVSALFWESVLSLRVWIARGFDVIHACNPPDLLYLVAGVWKIFFGVRFIFDQHDIGPELYEAKFGRRDFFWTLLCFFECRSFALADVSIATNNSYRDIAVSRGRMAPEKVFVVRSGPNPARVRELPPDSRWKNGRTFLVAYVGVIGAQEGLDLLLESVAHIARVRGRNDVQFVIMGDGPELADIRDLARALALDSRVTFTGRVDDETLFTVLSTAEVCVNPDRPNAMNDKSTMNKIMEYMALGKPIVQFDLTEGRFSAGEASLYAKNTDTADFGDRILELLDDPARRAAIGAFGRDRVRDVLAWPHEAPKLLAAYEAALGGDRAAPATAAVAGPAERTSHG
ncbi:MAG TPA: glycosyltransferase family 4 protein [Rhizomicrobium sp.]|nr:glycosyltransferase family 4 protein [Rhizomicrobium sp.]